MSDEEGYEFQVEPYEETNEVPSSASLSENVYNVPGADELLLRQETYNQAINGLIEQAKGASEQGRLDNLTAAAELEWEFRGIAGANPAFLDVPTDQLSQNVEQARLDREELVVQRKEAMERYGNSLHTDMLDRQLEQNLVNRAAMDVELTNRADLANTDLQITYAAHQAALDERNADLEVAYHDIMREYNTYEKSDLRRNAVKEQADALLAARNDELDITDKTVLSRIAALKVEKTDALRQRFVDQRLYEVAGVRKQAPEIHVDTTPSYEITGGRKR